MCQYPLFETLAIRDGIIQNLPYHQVRYEQACRNYLNTEPCLNLAKIIDVSDEFKTGLVRCKLEYDSQDYHIQFFPYSAKKITCFSLYYAENLDYRFKYSKRDIFQTMPTNENSEVIIINDGKVSDCTIGNLLFLKREKWYSSQDYLLKGTQLSRLLDEKRVELCEITPENLPEFEQVMMINALNPFDLARALPMSAIHF